MTYDAYVYGNLRFCVRRLSEGKLEANKAATNLCKHKSSNFYTGLCCTLGFFLANIEISPIIMKGMLKICSILIVISSSNPINCRVKIPIYNSIIHLLS